MLELIAWISTVASYVVVLGLAYLFLVGLIRFLDDRPAARDAHVPPPAQDQ